MIIKKITTGWVTQEFDAEKNQFVGQHFSADDSSASYEDEDGYALFQEAPEGAKRLLSFEMVQPKTKTQELKNQLRKKLKIFNAAGGRGIELAEEIDALQAEIYTLEEEL